MSKSTLDQLWLYRGHTPLETKVFKKGDRVQVLSDAEDYIGVGGHIASLPQLLSSAVQSPIEHDTGIRYILTNTEFHPAKLGPYTEGYIVLHGASTIDSSTLPMHHESQSSILTESQKQDLLNGRLPNGQELEGVLSMEDLWEGHSYDKFAVVVEGSANLHFHNAGFDTFLERNLVFALLGGEAVADAYARKFPQNTGDNGLSTTYEVREFGGPVGVSLNGGIQIDISTHNYSNDRVLATNGQAISPMGNGAYRKAKRAEHASLNPHNTKAA